MRTEVLGVNTLITVRLINAVNSDVDPNGHSYLASVDEPMLLNRCGAIVTLVNTGLALTRLDTERISYHWNLPRCSSAAASVALITLTPGQKLPPETQLTFRLQTPLYLYL